MMKTAHFLYCPFTGLGLYGGYRGKRWLSNRLRIFEQFVLPSIMSQTNRDFILWFSWRYEDISNPLVQHFVRGMQKVEGLRVVHTYAGVCFWDDKYPDELARDRLINSVHESMPELLNIMGDASEVLMTIQPSDDVYHSNMVSEVQAFFQQNPTVNVFGYRHGYVMDYVNRRLAEWNPKTTPPFYTIRFPRETFMDPLKHLAYTGPYKSHEYVKDFLESRYVESRGFLVGTHGENISTIFNHPYAGHEFLGGNVDAILADFGLAGVPPLHIRTSLRRAMMKHLPHGWQRKLRYWLGERFYARIYDWIRS